MFAVSRGRQHFTISTAPVPADVTVQCIGEVLVDGVQTPPEDVAARAVRNAPQEQADEPVEAVLVHGIDTWGAESEAA